MNNHLKNETSPYLLQHAENPVDWYPWCREAFERAKKEDKPIFLSIGYSTCHWCHVMAHESFENTATAEIMNRSFISIKVDREERPDIDSVYMSVCQALTGSGGWPMSIFMTWDKKPFLAGTYFPACPQYGMPGFSDLLNAVADQWNSGREELLHSADRIIGHLKHRESGFGNPGQPDSDYEEPGQSKCGYGDLGQQEPGPGDLKQSGAGLGNEAQSKSEYGKLYGANLPGEAVKMFSGSFDSMYGGFGGAPKFPVPHNLLFLLLYAVQEDKPEVLEMAEKTLMQMRLGGIFDHIGYGFSRYSTDRYFLAPHFEKMLYDNALLIAAYASAYHVTGKTVYLDTAEKTARYIFREMTSPDGGFYSAQDADSEGIEGKYYTFAAAEITDILGAKRGKKFSEAFDITREGNFEGMNIPNLLSSRDLDSDFEAETRKLYHYRKGRSKLHLDDKILVSWNSMMIAALSVLYRVSRKEEYLQAAVRAQGFIEGNLCGGLQLYTSWRGGKRAENSFLDDYAFYTAALTELYNATLDRSYLEKAEQFCMEAVKRFSDGKNGGFFLSDPENTELFMNPKECYDGAVPSGNSVMAYNLIRLYQLTEKEDYNRLARKQLRYMAGRAEDYLMGHSMFLFAQLIYDNPPEHITVVLKNSSDLEEIKGRLPLLANVVVVPESKEYHLINGKTAFYVCKNHVCLPGCTADSRNPAALTGRKGMTGDSLEIG